MMLEHFAYALVLLVSIGGLATLDHRFKLAFFYDKSATIVALGIGMLLFIVWDVLGIMNGIFFTGTSPYILGLYLLPEFPVEELLFLFLLCYNTLLLWRGSTKIWPTT